MNITTNTPPEAGAPPDDHVSVGELALETLVGAAAGATTGLLAGPVGVVAGAVLGGAAGAAAAAALHQEERERAEREARLDEEVGVIGGNIGEARPDAPPPRAGLFHATSLGVSPAKTVETAEGPIQSLDEE